MRFATVGIHPTGYLWNSLVSSDVLVLVDLLIPCDGYGL